MAGRLFVAPLPTDLLAILEDLRQAPTVLPQ
jgi:hypothetical protein